MRFWDSSAIAPLLVQEKETAPRQRDLEKDPVLVVWWGTAVELESVLTRRRNEGALDEPNEAKARARLAMLAEAWIEVEPTDPVREMAKRLIRVHSLRSADSLQLAAALTACGNRPQNHVFLSGDQALKVAAGKEGFVV